MSLDDTDYFCRFSCLRTMNRYRALPLNVSGWLLRAALLAALLLLLPLSQVSAAEIIVSDTCSLKDAVQAAEDDSNTHNTNCTAGSGADVIKLPANGKTLLTLTTVPDRIDTSMTIDGQGHTLDGQGQVQILFIGMSGSATTVTIKNLTLIKGQPPSPSPAGAIKIQSTSSAAASTIRLENIKIKNSSTKGDNANGGGIFIEGRNRGHAITLDRVEISDSYASGSGGGMYVDRVKNVTIKNSAFINNRASGGGGLFVSSNANNNVTIENSTFSGNRATGGGAAIKVEGGTLTLKHVTIAGNRAGGGLVVSGGTVNLRNTIIANNSGGDCNGSLNENTNSIVRRGCSTDSEWSVDPGLASLRGSPAYFPLYAGSPAINAGATSHCSTTDQRGITRLEGEGDGCDLGAYEGSIPRPPEPESDDGDGLPYLTPTPATLLAAPLPALETCKSLPENIVVSAPTGRPQCQQLGAAGIGNAAVINRGIIDAVDIWSWLGAGVQVCFRQTSGTLLFLDAATAPRAISELPVYNIDGMICAFIDRAGTVVLVPGPPLPAATDTPPPSLSDCMVYTQYALNFRDAPDGKIIDILPFNVTLTAVARTPGWFKVDFYGAQGWISAKHVEPRGTCG